jgi:hypothetical protein
MAEVPVPPKPIRKCLKGPCQVMLAAGTKPDRCETHQKEKALARKRQRDAKNNKENKSATQIKKSLPVPHTDQPLVTGSPNVENVEVRRTQDIDSSDTETRTKRQKVSPEVVPPLFQVAEWTRRPHFSLPTSLHFSASFMRQLKRLNK